MTAPTGTGRAVTLQPGAAPVMLTEYAATADPAAALQIINSNVTAGRVWISSDGAVSPATGVPLDAGTSIPWATPGQVWAVLDPAATAPVTLTLTSAVTDWTPSPAAIAAEVAAQLLATGVPNVLVETELAAGQVIVAGGTASFDVSGYASAVLIAAGNPVLSGASVEVTQQDSNGVQTDQEYVNTTSLPGPPSGVRGGVARIALSGPTLIVKNLSAIYGVSITLIASNRPAARYDTRYNTANGDSWSVPSKALAGTVNLTQTDPSVQLSGQCYAAFVVSNAAVTGNFALVTNAGRDVTICSTAEMVASPFSGKLLTKMIAVPAGGYSISFFVSAGGTGSLAVDLIAA